MAKRYPRPPMVAKALPQARKPGVPIPGAPRPGVPIPGAPRPGVPIPGAPIPGAPRPRHSVPSHPHQAQPDVHHQHSAVPNLYGNSQGPGDREDMGHRNAGNTTTPYHNQGFASGQGDPAGAVEAPPPLPPKPGPPKSQACPPAGAQFHPNLSGNPLNSPPGPGAAPPQQVRPPIDGERGGYAYVLDPKEQEINRLNATVSDTVSQLKDKTLELSRCNSELSKSWQCLKDKKEEIAAQNEELVRLREEVRQLRQVVNTGRAHPQVAQSEAALQMELDHYRKRVQELTSQVEGLRRQPPAPATDVQELMRLREEVQWHHGERQRMMGQITALRSSEEILTAQAKTYKEDFENEREDRQRAHAQIDRMQQEIDNLTQIVTMLGGERQQ